jgi:hypothetical protein
MRAASPPTAPHLPPGEAGKVLAQALEAAGGWQRWMSLHDVGYVNTLTLLDPFGNISSQSIGWYMAPLHLGMQARMESIGLTNPVTLGINNRDTWISRDSTPVSEPQRLELARFNLVSNLFWFSLPFAVAEMPCTVTDLGEIAGESDTHWHRLKVVFAADNPVVPGEWFVLYINTRTGLIDRVHARITASFLRHEIWLGSWLDYQDWEGLKKERRREFYPADSNGKIIGNIVAEQLVEHVRFNNGYAPEHFKKPLPAPPAKAVRFVVPSAAGPTAAYNDSADKLNERLRRLLRKVPRSDFDTSSRCPRAQASSTALT